jgi:hypothetical protein
MIPIKKQNINESDSMSIHSLDSFIYDETTINPSNCQMREINLKTNSIRDYKYKAVGNYNIGIPNDKNFSIKKKILGKNGNYLKQIIIKCAHPHNDYSTKIRLRGKGSGYKEGENKEESNIPLQLCISSQDIRAFHDCCLEIEKLLNKIYFEYYVYQYNVMNQKFQNTQYRYPITMKKIDKQTYLIDRKI